MKKYGKRLSALLLTLAMLCAALPSGALAAEDATQAENHSDGKTVFYSEEPDASQDPDAEDRELPEEDVPDEADDGEADADASENETEEDYVDENARAEAEAQAAFGDGAVPENWDGGEPEEEPILAAMPPKGVTYNVADFLPTSKSPRKAIQKALNMALQTNGMITVYVPAGTYELDTSLTIYSNTTLWLEDGAYFIRKAGNTHSMLHAPNNVSNPKGYSRAANIIVMGGVWDGGLHQGENTTSLMVFRHCQNLTFQNFTIKHAPDHYINASSSADLTFSGINFQDAVVVSDKTVKSISSASTANEGRARFECIHLDTEGSDSNGLYDATTPQNVMVRNCTFRNVYAGVGAHRQSTYKGERIYANNVTIKNNHFENLAGRCVNAYQFKKLTVSGNVCRQVAGLAFLKSTTGTISGNSVTLQRWKGVVARGVQADNCSGLTVKSNPMKGDLERLMSFSQCKRLKVEKNSLKGAVSDRTLSLLNSEDAKVSGNKLTGSAKRFCYAGGCKNIQLLSNQVSGTASERMLSMYECEGAKVGKNKVSGTSKILLYSKYADKAELYSNTLKGGKEYAIRVSNCREATTKDNTLTKAGKSGISLTGNCTGAVISGNQVTGSSSETTEKGIFLSHGVHQTKVNRNKVSKAKSGVYVTGNTGAYVCYNDISGCNQASIYLTGTVKKARLAYNNTKSKGVKASPNATWSTLRPRTSKAGTGKAKKTLSVSWPQVDAASGYQVQYARVSSFKGSKSVTTKSGKAVKKTLKGLKSRTKYYVRVRAYRTLKGVKYYSAWSPVSNARAK